MGIFKIYDEQSEYDEAVGKIMRDAYEIGYDLKYSEAIRFVNKIKDLFIRHDYDTDKVVKELYELAAENSRFKTTEPEYEKLRKHPSYKVVNK